MNNSPQVMARTLTVISNPCTLSPPMCFRPSHQAIGWRKPGQFLNGGQRWISRAPSIRLGCHVLRKTWCYLLFTQTLPRCYQESQKCFCDSSTITLQPIGWNSEIMTFRRLWSPNINTTKLLQIDMSELICTCSKLWKNLKMMGRDVGYRLCEGWGSSQLGMILQDGSTAGVNACPRSTGFSLVGCEGHCRQQINHRTLSRWQEWGERKMTIDKSSIELFPGDYWIGFWTW